MNTKNNRRRRESMEKLEQVLVELLQTKELDEIRVSDLCQRAGLNRSTFYANYEDIYALADAIRERLESGMKELYRDELAAGYNSNNYLVLFHHIWNNQSLYRIYFKLGYDEQYRILVYDHDLAQRHFEGRFVEYHLEFFKSGLTKIIKLWLEKGCRETPEEMMEILNSEYRGRHF